MVADMKTSESNDGSVHGNPAHPGGYSGKKTAEIVGISYRQLDYWARTDLIRPSLADASGSGSRRMYSYRDLLELKVIKSLIDAGIKLQQVRQVFEYLHDHLDEGIAAANLVIDGGNVLLVQGDGELVDVLRKGQGVLNVLSIGRVQDELDAAIVELERPPAPVDASTNTDGEVLAPSAIAR